MEVDQSLFLSRTRFSAICVKRRLHSSGDTNVIVNEHVLMNECTDDSTTARITDRKFTLKSGLTRIA